MNFRRGVGKVASSTGIVLYTFSYERRQRGRVVSAPDLKSGGYGFKSRSDHLAGVVSWWTLVQHLGHACM